MRALFLSKFVRAKFAMTSRTAADATIGEQRDLYLALAGRVGEGSGSKCVRVPPMLGVDEDMREWSFFMILEHNTIVNRQITATVESLLCGHESIELENFDPKRDVMPCTSAGLDQVEAFAHSVSHHLSTISRYATLGGTGTRKHPIFGEFNAHCWHCMFGFHLKIHYKQSRCVVNSVAP